MEFILNIINVFVFIFELQFIVCFNKFLTQKIDINIKNYLNCS